MKKLAILLATTTTALFVSLGLGGATITPMAVTCSTFFPNTNYGCPAGGGYGLVISNQSWKQSPSFARRTGAGWVTSTGCLSTSEQIVIRYVRQNGSVYASQGGTFGACSGYWPMSSGNEYVRVQFRLVKNGGNTVGRQFSAYSNWF